MRREWIVAIVLAVAGLGCVEVKAPERIDIGGGPRSEHVDSSRVPHPATLSEAQMELDKAYRQIQYLEHETAGLEKDKRKLKEERDEYKRKYKRAKSD